MKAILIIFLSLAFSNAISDINLNTQVGSSCNSTGAFFITDFNINPWPPVQRGNSSAEITGLIRQALSISQIWFVFQDQNQIWNWYWQMIFKSYNVGQVINFNILFSWPNAPGAYDAYFDVSANDLSLTVEGCWTFSFSY